MLSTFHVRADKPQSWQKSYCQLQHKECTAGFFFTHPLIKVIQIHSLTFFFLRYGDSVLLRDRPILFSKFDWYPKMKWKCHRHDCLYMLSSLVKTNDIKLTLLAVTTAKIPIGQKQTTEKIERANKHGLLSADRGGNGLCKNNKKKSPCQHTIKVLSSN